MAYPVSACRGHIPVNAKAFAPTDVTGLRAWYDFSDATTMFTDAGTTPVSSDGDLIYRANDKSGNNYHVSQDASGKRPSYKVNIKNGLSVGRFVGSDNNLNRASTSVLDVCGVSTGTIFSVLMETTGTGGGVFIINASGGDYIDNYISASWGYNTDLIFDYYGYTTARVSCAKPAWWSGNYHVVYGRRNGSSMKLFADGNILATKADASGSNSGGTATLYIGGQGLSVSRDICEVLAFNVSVSDDDVTKLVNYLNTKWAVY